MARKTIITCALTGGTAVPRNHPNFPITPKQIAQQGIDAAVAGASVLHIHVREADGKPSGEIALYREVVDRIRQADDKVIINLTTGFGCIYIPIGERYTEMGPGSNMLSAQERVHHVLELKPEICTLDMNTMQMADVMSGNRQSVLVTMNLEPVIVDMAAAIRAAGVLPEVEIFESGDCARATKLIEQGVLEGPGLFTIILAPNYGLPPTTASMMFAVGALPRDCMWTGMGVGSYQFPLAAQSWLLGGHIRVGLEDNLYLAKGEYAPSNAALVTRAREILEPMGAQIATASEARAMLKLTA